MVLQTLLGLLLPLAWIRYVHRRFTPGACGPQTTRRRTRGAGGIDEDDEDEDVEGDGSDAPGSI